MPSSYDTVQVRPSQYDSSRDAWYETSHRPRTRHYQIQDEQEYPPSARSARHHRRRSRYATGLESSRGTDLAHLAQMSLTDSAYVDAARYQKSGGSAYIGPAVHIPEGRITYRDLEYNSNPERDVAWNAKKREWMQRLRHSTLFSAEAEAKSLDRVTGAKADYYRYQEQKVDRQGHPIYTTEQSGGWVSDGRGGYTRIDRSYSIGC